MNENMSSKRKEQEMRLVRVYMNEKKAHLDSLMQFLDQRKMRGVTVFRGIAGFGDSGKWHMANLIDLALDLPLVVEFFEYRASAEKSIIAIHKLLPQAHIISWDIELSFEPPLKKG
jgi:PII-like signaling protein